LEGEKEMHTNFYSENLKGRDHFQGLGVDGRMILKLILREWDVDWVHHLWIGINGGLL